MCITMPSNGNSHPRASDVERGGGLAFTSTPTPFRHCDRLSYSYLIMGLLFCVIGVYFTLVPLEGFSHMSTNFWFIGPAFIFFGFLMTMRMVMYLRNKLLLLGILRQREIIQMVRERASSPPNVEVHPTFIPPRPPAYSTLPTPAQSPSGTEAPPPSYEQAMNQQLHKDATPAVTNALDLQQPKSLPGS